MGAMNVIWCSEGTSSWSIKKSTLPVQQKPGQLCFTTCNCRWELTVKYKARLETSLFATPRKFGVIASARRVVATVFWAANGAVLTDYLEHGSTIIGTYYDDLIRKVLAALKEKRQGKLFCGVLLHQENAPAHTSSQKLGAIDNAGFKLLLYLSPFLDLVPSDLYLFPELKEFLKEYRFADNKDVICVAKCCLKDQDQQFFYNGIQALEKCETKCISVAEDYAEKWQNIMYLSCD